MNRRCFLTVTVLAPALSLTGCGPGRGSLSGKVSFRRQLVTSGTVSALGSDLKIQYTPIQSDGTYHLPDVTGGTVKLAVESPNPEQSRSETAATEPGSIAATLPVPQRGPSTSKPKDWFEVPAQYARFEDSGLSVEVSGSTTYDIEITV